MEELLVKFIMGFDLNTILSISVVFWFMTKGMKNDIKEIRNDIKGMHDNIQDLDRRLCRIEGAISSKECCRLIDNGKLEKAE